jgi:hypothetical protein
MLLVLMGRSSREPSDQGFIARAWELLESSLNDLVSEVVLLPFLTFVFTELNYK